MKLKSLFSTPKKAILTSVCVAAVLAVTGTATVFTAEGIAKSSSIGTTAAEEKALSDAGVNKEDAAFSVTEFEFQKGRFVYDVEFTAGGIEYDYVIKASDGTVLSRKAKVDDDDLQQVTAAPDNTAPTTLADEYISLDAAKTKALDDAGLNASDVSFTKEKLDVDDGVTVYDIEFYTSDAEYDYEINAETGAVHERSVDWKEGDPPSQNEQSYIILDAAKGKALDDAGLNASDVSFTKEKLDVDDGVTVYDIEFYTSDAEYDYEINAETGAVHKRSVDRKEGNPPTQTEQSYISLDAAKTKALSDAGVKASAATFTKEKLDSDDGIAVYDLEFYTEENAYDYEINAKTGTVHEKSIEKREQTQQPQGGNSGSYIGVEKAKTLALNHAGLSAGEVSLSKAKFENDDGIMVYEIEFIKDRTEYEYTIDAASGKILEFDSEYDD